LFDAEDDAADRQNPGRRGIEPVMTDFPADPLIAGATSVRRTEIDPGDRKFVR
jgi:hypothetical protein